MQADALRAADWYDDPEHPGRLRYWDGAAWTDHRAEPLAEQPRPVAAAEAVQDAPAAVEQPKPAGEPKQPKEPKPPRPEGEEPSFGVVVIGVLGGAVALIAVIVLMVVWVSSYNAGHSRGEQAAKQGVESSQASTYCNSIAKDRTLPGSAGGYWDMPWIWGCKRGLG